MPKGVTKVQPKPTIQGLLETMKPQISTALPRHMSADRMSRIALTEIRKNPKLAQCDPISFIGAIIQCSQLGLEPGNSLGHAYLIPFKNNKRGITECQLIPGYRGLIDLARRSGNIKSINAHCVYERDYFEYEYGLEEKLVHKPGCRIDSDKIIYVYAVAKLMDGGYQFEVMTIEEVEKIRDGKRGNNPVWDSHFDEMARKTAVRRLFKYLPVSIEMRKAHDLEVLDDQGRSQGNQAVIDPDFLPEYETAESTTIKQINEKGAVKDLDQNLAYAKETFNNLIKDYDLSQSAMVKIGVQFHSIHDWTVEQYFQAIELIEDVLNTKKG